MKTKLFKKIESYEAYAIELQRGLTAIPALAPSSGGAGEYDKALWLEGELKKLKFDSIEWINAPQKEAKRGIRPNIVARYKGKKTGKTLWLMSHLDIVPPGEAKLWNSDPYKLVVKGRNLTGRGVEDNQQATVSSILVVKAMMELDFRPEFDIALLFCADEETGSGFGADYIAENKPEIFGKNDMFFIPDSGSEDGSAIEIAEKSILWMKVTTHGRQCHASRPGLGINAFKAASELVIKYKSLYEKFPHKDDLYEPPISTFEPTKKEANVPNVNTLPGEDVFYMDCRVMPVYLLSEVKAEMRRLAGEVEKMYGVKITFEPQQEAQAAPPTSKDAAIVKAVEKAIREVYKVEPKVQGIGGGTVAAFFRRLNLPAVVYSRLNESAHQPNEYCILDNLIGDAKVFALSALILGEEKPIPG
ncbi:MAG TPA: diaminopimelate aminotransferase [Elusimicrobia bacterium]|nr:MAG: diaminopimelate aminotransferase [Elusimicrobia bacterium GWA2_51_34]HAF95704.1 diaminopimelate aminotransferase [Elusimicrobiota bacterium]HCE97027.1 diaminopimelate aminotransferase [Elusimicrobiota bacterium]